VKETIPTSITLTRLLATTTVMVASGVLEEAAVVPTTAIAYCLVASASTLWTADEPLKRTMEPAATLLVAEAAQADIPVIWTWKLAVESLAIVTVTEEPEISHLLTRSECVVDGAFPEEVKT
jgi:hypothetical protein